MIGELLGFNQSIPPFATARGRDILVGVNYASGAAGIRDETGRQLNQPKQATAKSCCYNQSLDSTARDGEGSNRLP
uniref:Uncharacterized protein n=1 Tax=Salix viminalis TaxID=40686 RepID=A0A6N2KIT5_SALVM